MKSELFNGVESLLFILANKNPLQRYDLPVSEVKAAIGNYCSDNPDKIINNARDKGLVEEDQITKMGSFGPYSSGRVLFITEKGRQAYNSLPIKKLLGDLI